MIISPVTAVESGWVTWNNNIDSIDKYIQPNALDFDCASIFFLDDRHPAYLSEDRKVMRRLVQQFPQHMPDQDELFWHLHNNQCYDFTSNFHVKLPAGVAARLIIRSTLNRCGVFLTSGLYDSGFDGHIAGMLRIQGGDFNLAPNTRIGQIEFVRSEDSGKLYAGGYNHKAGTHWTAETAPGIAQQLEQASAIQGDSGGKIAGQQSFI